MKHLEVFVANGVRSLALSVDEQIALLISTKNEINTIMQLISDQRYDSVRKLLMNSSNFIVPMVGIYELSLATGAIDMNDNETDHSYNAFSARIIMNDLIEEIEINRDIEHGVIEITVDGPHTDFMVDPEDD